jgi:hypothetical protein
VQSRTENGSPAPVIIRPENAYVVNRVKRTLDES